MFKKSLPASLLLIILPLSATASPMRIGSLAFGTLNWELAVIRDQGLDKTHGLTIETTPLANPEAGKIAIQGNSLDVIVSDWIWVARQRQQGQDFSFSPYSNSHGALVVSPDSNIRRVEDLAGKRLGIAGGGLDKNWLMLRAMAMKTAGIDLDKAASKTFAAPPLINQAIQKGELDAAMNYWNFAVKLEARGYRRILDGQQVIRSLGIQAAIPSLGYVFREKWATEHRTAIDGFLEATGEARRMICESDSVWATVAPLTHETDTRIQQALRNEYCAGSIKQFGEAEIRATGEVFDLLNSFEPDRKPSPLPAGMFWQSGKVRQEPRLHGKSQP